MTTDTCLHDLNLVKSYMQLRIDGKINNLLDLLTDNIVLVSERDGEFIGKQKVKAYLEKTKPSGTWAEPRLSLSQPEGVTIVVPGQVTFLFMTFDVIASFSVVQGLKISKIEIKRGKL
jgi:hypothetical protein